MCKLPDIGRRNHDAVGFAAAFRISFIDLIVFPKLLPLGFGGGRKDWAGGIFAVSGNAK